MINNDKDIIYIIHSNNKSLTDKSAEDTLTLYYEKYTTCGSLKVDFTEIEKSYFVCEGNSGKCYINKKYYLGYCFMGMSRYTFSFYNPEGNNFLLKNIDLFGINLDKLNTGDAPIYLNGEVFDTNGKYSIIRHLFKAYISKNINDIENEIDKKIAYFESLKNNLSITESLDLSFMQELRNNKLINKELELTQGVHTIPLDNLCFDQELDEEYINKYVERVLKELIKTEELSKAAENLYSYRRK